MLVLVLRLSYLLPMWLQMPSNVSIAKEQEGKGREEEEEGASGRQLRYENEEGSPNSQSDSIKNTLNIQIHHLRKRTIGMRIELLPPRRARIRNNIST